MTAYAVYHVTKYCYRAHSRDQPKEADRFVSYFPHYQGINHKVVRRLATSATIVSHAWEAEVLPLNYTRAISF